MSLDPKVAIWLNVAYAVLTGLTAPALQAAGIADASQVVAIAAPNRLNGIHAKALEMNQAALRE